MSRFNACERFIDGDDEVVLFQNDKCECYVVHSIVGEDEEVFRSGVMSYQSALRVLMARIIMMKACFAGSNQEEIGADVFHKEIGSVLEVISNG